MNELMPRATIHQIEADRNKALLLFEEAFDKLEEGRELAARAAANSGYGGLSEKAVRALAPTYDCSHRGQRRGEFLTEMQHIVDRRVWGHLFKAVGIEDAMDATARREWREQLEGEPPAVTAETAFATLENLHQQRGQIFRRGIAVAFSKLDRRFRSHDGFKFGDRIVITSALTEHGHWNSYTDRDATIFDVERGLYTVIGKTPPAREKSILGLIDTERMNQGFGNFSGFTVEDDMMKVRAFKNGNIHMWITDKDALKGINGVLASYYGAGLGEGWDAANEAAAEQASTEPRRDLAARNMGWFWSPKEVVDRAVGWAPIKWAGARVLEPSAGEGALALAAREEGAHVDCIELHAGRAETLRSHGFDVRETNFLAVTAPVDPADLYDIILMNPPFDRGLDCDHVRHAMDFLKPGGVIVAIMSAGTEYRSDKRTKLFRKVVDQWERITSYTAKWHDLPVGAFEEAGTNVSTVLLVAKKPENWVF